MGFKMQSRSGQDLSFVVTIEKTEDGTIGMFLLINTNYSNWTVWRSFKC